MNLSAKANARKEITVVAKLSVNAEEQRQNDEGVSHIKMVTSRELLLCDEGIKNL